MARICVFCASSSRIDPIHLRLAHDVGAEIARRGHDLVSGGGRTSMMGAVAEAVRAGGGHTLGVIPQALVEREVADTGAHELVVTSDMRVRKGHMDAAADAFIALPGGIGTLEELFEIWTARALAMHHRPIVVLDPEGVFSGVRAAVDTLVDHGFVSPAAAAVVFWSKDVLDALDRIEEEWQTGGPRVGLGE